MSTTNTISSSKSETVNYLLLYEAMVRHQDLEFDATHDHIKLTVDRVRYLGRRKKNGGASVSSNGEDVPGLEEEEDAPEGMLTYLQMRRCLLRLGYTWNRSLPSYGGGSSQPSSVQYDDDVSVASVNSASTFISGGGVSNTSGFGVTRDIIATDAQLIMLLTTLVEMEEKYRAMKLAAAGNGNREDEGIKDPNSQGLYLPEFIQAYKLIIGGMQSLQTYPNPDTDDATTIASICSSIKMPSCTPEALSELRARSRERTLGLLRLFGPDDGVYKDFDTASSTTGGGEGSAQSAGESPTSRKKGSTAKDALTPNRSNAKRNVTPNSNSRGGSMMAKDGLQPRLSDAEIRKLVHSKDTALAKILEEHETEMNVMATNMEELRLKERRIQANLRKRRKRTRLAVLLGLAFAIAGGVALEYKRREVVSREIQAGREEERKADAQTIARLKKEIGTLSQKLNDAEATIRYEESRYETIKSASQKTKKDLEAMEAKWLMDQGELERCRVTRKELDTDLTRTKETNHAVEEEVSWCRERLQSTERAMEGMERVLKNRNTTIAVPSFADIAKKLGEDDKAAALMAGEKNEGGEAGTKKGGSKIKPVQMEMKFNKSFRNAVILRQAYSAVGGIAVSLLLQGLIPGVGKLISMLFLGA